MSSNLAQAKRLLEEEGYTCAACDGEACRVSRLRGVRPLLEWLDAGETLEGFSAADKVVGNGAAFLYVLLQVKEVYAPVMSRSAADTLEREGIPFFAEKIVPGIQNRKGTGSCPMESAVSGTEDPQEALEAIRRTLQKLAAMQKNTQPDTE